MIDTDPTLIGSSPAMRRLRDGLDQIARHDVSVLIRGESGTGKELVARAIHSGGRRQEQPFLPLNCSSISETLIDSELFGHAKGSFTGATVDRPGVFVNANGGTLFLDEIGDMPLASQARLLRVLQEGELRAVGSDRVRNVDVRIVAATNVDLDRAVAEGRFRQDLYYRLAVVTVHVPPLRDRLEDIPQLVAHFLRKHGGQDPPAVLPEVLDLMAAFSWPGNVRQLENALLHALAFQRAGRIDIESLPSSIFRTTVPVRTAQADHELLSFTEAKRRVTATFERRYLVRVLERANGSISEAARIAGIDRTNLRRLMKRYDIPAAVRRSSSDRRDY